MLQKIDNKWGFRIGILICFGIAFFLRVFRLDSAPYGMHIDEAGMAYDAWCLATYGVDRWLNHTPVYLINFGGGQSALMAYLCAILIKLNHGIVTTVIARLPGVIVNLCGWWAGVLLIKKLLGKNWALVSAFLLSIMPYFILQCRMGLDCNMLVNMLTISIYALVLAIDKNSTWMYAVAGVVWGGTYYTYVLCYIPNTLAIIIIAVVLIKYKKCSFRQIVVWWIPIIVFGLPLFGMLCINLFELDSVMILGITLPRLQFFRGNELSLMRVWDNLIEELLTIVTHDKFPYNSLPKYDNYYKLSVIFFVIGIIDFYRKEIIRIKKKEYSHMSVLGIIWFLYLGMGTLLSDINVNVINGMLFISFCFIVFGMQTCYETLQNKIANGKLTGVICCGVLCIYMALGVNFSVFYFEEWKEQPIMPLFDTDYKNLLQEPNKITYIDCEKDDYIYFLYSLTPDPFAYDLPNRGNGEYKNFVLGMPAVLEDKNDYIVHWGDERYTEWLQTNGFSEVERSGFWAKYSK